MCLWSPEDNLECHYSNISHHFYWDRDSRYPVSPWVDSIGMPAGPRNLSVPASLALGVQWHTITLRFPLYMSSENQTRVLLLQALSQWSCLPSHGFSLDFSFQINKMQCLMWAAQWESVAFTSHQRRFFYRRQRPLQKATAGQKAENNQPWGTQPQLVCL